MNSRIRENSKFIFILLFINSQIFSYSVNNPFGIKGVIEIFNLFLIFYAIYYLLQNSLKIKKLDLIVFLTPILLIFLSAILALVEYGQPFYAGVIEERRMLSLYIYFPLIKYYRDKNKDINSLYFYILLSSIFAIILGLLYQLDIFNGFNVTTSSSSTFRSDRATSGNQYIVLSVIISYCSIIFNKTNNIKNYFLILVFILSLLFISQSRGMVIALILVLFFIYKDFFHFVLKNSTIILGGSIVILASIVVNTENIFIDKILAPFLELTSDEYIKESVRSQSISKIINDMSFLGHGALWLQWNSGFSRIYGEYFFLSDVGIWGTLFRYGIFTIIPLSTLAYFIIKILSNEKQNIASLVSKGILLHIVFMLPIAGAFEYRGFIIAIALVIYSSSKKPEFTRQKTQ